MITTVGIERLRTLYAMLAGIPAKRLDLLTWRGASNDIPDEKLLNEHEMDCGTTACAVGWACAYPPFKKEGLIYKLGSVRGPSFAGSAEWEAVSSFFGIDKDWARLLFLDKVDNYYLLDEGADDITDHQRVMRRIRRFLMQEGAITSERNAELARQEGVPA